MIGRRAILLGAAGSATAMIMPRVAAAIPGTLDRLAFDAIRKGSTIGTHVVTFEHSGDNLLVRTDVQLRVGLGPITLFRYHHQAIERWRGAEFVGIETTTDNNGEALRVSARRVGDAIRIDSSKLGQLTMVAAALPLTHWNIQCMSVPVFNPQDGTALDAPVTPRGMETVLLGNGTKVQSRRFSMGGEAPIDDWYDDTQTWTHLRATAKDGSVVEYRRTV
jgi:hypothetical protein